jgi:hypothetical protein
MPSHKVFKSVVRSLTESFTSYMSYRQDDYVVGHIVQAAWLTGATVLEFDLVTGEAKSSGLLVSPVSEALERLHQRFPDLVARSGASMEFVRAATMTVTVDPTVKRPPWAGSRGDYCGLYESPFTCTTRVVDDRGATYEYGVDDWWFPENPEGEGFVARELEAASNKRFERTP